MKGEKTEEKVAPGPMKSGLWCKAEWPHVGIVCKNILAGRGESRNYEL
jgi:hypothetical protein